ncbi:hypothetical protein BGZ60DRAFT_421646 [Tricladium varicosporioides]|nr:hypothetical protein BGZ60DRAFT_421646 [Hymenoscyphus varicosporioides]
MQSANKRTDKLHKKPKLAAKSATDESAANESVDDSSADDSSNNVPPTNLPPANDPPNDEPPNKTTTFETTEDPRTMKSLKTLGEAPAIASLIDGDETHVDSAAERDLPTITHTDGMALLDEYFPKSATDSRPLNGVVPDEMPTSVADTPCQDSPLPLIQSYSPETLTLPPSAGTNDAPFEASDIVDPKHSGSGFETSISSVASHELESSRTDSSSNTTSETNATDLELPDAVIYTSFARRPVLDNTDQLLDCVLVALENTYDNRRNPNSSVPGVLDDVLMKDDHTTFVKIMTSVTENWAQCIRLITKSLLEVAQERLQEIKRKTSNYISENRCQISISREDRVKSERLKHAIICLDVRELSGIELQDLLSEPVELIAEFSEESEYDITIKRIEKEYADNIRSRLRHLWKETYYWPMIQQRAKMIGPVSKSTGPKTDITLQEKLAAKKLLVAMGHGQGRNNIFKWTSYLKLLSNMRDKGATALLLGRTSEFKNYFFHHPKELEMLHSWNRLYAFPLHQLRLRVIAQEENDFSGKSDIEEQWICDRLHAPQNMCWGDHLSFWDQESTEHKDFLANHSLKPTSTKSNTHVLRYGIKSQLDRNKSIYVSLIPYEGQSNKRTFSNKTASTELLAVAPLVAIAPGEFLGLFPGRLRYTDHKPTRAISGPVSNLWLDYSEVMGKLNKIKVAKDGEVTNVCLAWEGVNEVKGDKSGCQYLRVLVIATRHIMPFDQLIRPSSGAGILSGYDGRCGLSRTSMISLVG